MTPQSVSDSLRDVKKFSNLSQIKFIDFINSKDSELACVLDGLNIELGPLLRNFGGKYGCRSSKRLGILLTSDS